MTALRSILFVIIGGLLLLQGCGSGGSTGPAPIDPVTGSVSILYCRVVVGNLETRLQWATDKPASAEIRYGLTTYTDLMAVPARLDTHDVALAGLAYNAHYIYRLKVEDSLGHSAEYTGEFTTPDKAFPEPVISGFTIQSVTETSAQVSWRTDEPATTILYYGHASLTDSVVKDSFAVVHAVLLQNLQPSTSYLMKPAAVDTTDLYGFGRDTLLTTATRMTLWFPDTTVGMGDTIALPILIRDVQDLAALRFGFTFDPGSMEVLAVEAGPFYTNHRGFIFFQDIRNSTGRVYADLTWNISYNGNVRTGTDADGSGIVAYARLRGLTGGNSHTAFIADSSFALDIFSTQRACSLRAGQITVLP
jgi:hypothetical protein